MPDAVNVRDLHQVTLDQDLERGRGLEHSEHGVEGTHVREAGATTGPHQLVGDIAGRRCATGHRLEGEVESLGVMVQQLVDAFMDATSPDRGPAGAGCPASRA